MFFTSIGLTFTKLLLSLLILIVLLPTFSAEGQVIQTKRFELGLGKEEGQFEIISVGDRGLFLQRRVTSGVQDNIELVKIDTSFQMKWRGYLPVDRRLMMMGKRSYGDALYLLLRHQDVKQKDFQLYKVSADSGSFIVYTIKNFIPFTPTDFQVTPEAAIIGGYFNHIPVVVFYSFKEQRTKVLPGLLNENGELTQIKIYHDHSFDVLISARNWQGQQTIWIKSYDPYGDLIRNYALAPEANKNMIFARSIKTEDDVQLVAGVYGSRNTEYSKGIFLASIDQNGQQQIKYYNYADFENFFKYMKVKREKRVKDRIERRKIKGKKIRFNYRFLVHEIVPYNNQFVLLGEAFYPQYINLDRTYYSGFFSPAQFSNAMVRDGRIFDGYRYTHAVVVGFSPDGKVLWDNSFEINDVKTFTLEQFVKLEIHPDKIALLYLFENNLRSKIIQHDEVVEGKTIEPLKTSLQSDIARAEKTSSTKLDYWYQDYFYASGVQEIENPQTGKRRVFFINKLSYGQ